MTAAARCVDSARPRARSAAWAMPPKKEAAAARRRLGRGRPSPRRHRGRRRCRRPVEGSHVQLLRRRRRVARGGGATRRRGWAFGARSLLHQNNRERARAKRRPPRPRLSRRPRPTTAWSSRTRARACSRRRRRVPPLSFLERAASVGRHHVADERAWLVCRRPSRAAAAGPEAAAVKRVVDIAPPSRARPSAAPGRRRSARRRSGTPSKTSGDTRGPDELFVLGDNTHAAPSTHMDARGRAGRAVASPRAWPSTRFGLVARSCSSPLRHPGVAAAERGRMPASAERGASIARSR